MSTWTLFSQANPGSVTSGAGNAGTNGIHFTVSAVCQLDGVWHYSPATSTQLPVTIALYTTQASPATGTLVTSQAATWSGVAGSGWVFAPFTSPPVLTSGVNYMAANWRNDTVNEWFVFYAVTWPKSNGILTAPADTGAGQGWYDTGTPGSLTFPASQLAGDNYGMDVQVSTPPAAQPQRPRGKPTARKARLAYSPPPPAVVPPVTPSPFSPPPRPTQGRPSARKARAAGNPGSPVVPPTPPTSSPFSAPGAIRRAHAAIRKARGNSSPGSPVAVPTPSPFTPPVKPARGKAAARRSRLAASPGAAVVPSTRRLLVSLAARGGTDDYGNPYLQGLQVFQGIIKGSTMLGADWIINTAGAFFYNGPPGPNTLVMSIAAQAGTDPYGTPYGPGFYLTDNLGAYAAFASSGGIPSLALQAAGLIHSTAIAAVFAQALGAGGASEAQLAVFTSGKSGGDDAAIQLFSEAADASSPAKAVLEFGGTVALTVTKTQAVTAVPFVADSWNNITFDSGWTGVETPQYRLLPDGNVQVRGQLSHTSITTVTALNSGHPLPSAYWPAATRYYRPPDPIDGAGLIQIGANGVFSVRANATYPATQVILDGIYSI